jgi:hypothetical protein
VDDADAQAMLTTTRPREREINAATCYYNRLVNPLHS